MRRPADRSARREARRSVRISQVVRLPVVEAVRRGRAAKAAVVDAVGLTAVVAARATASTRRGVQWRP
jgi:hypothetical protein